MGVQRNVIDARGERYGALVALHAEGTPTRLGRSWAFRCDCGAIVVRVLARVRHAAKNGVWCACPTCISRRKKLQRRAGGYRRIESDHVRASPMDSTDEVSVLERHFLDR